jgi:hypothetical protein
MPRLAAPNAHCPRRAPLPTDLSSFVHRPLFQCAWETRMIEETAELDRLQLTYKAAVDEWVIAIRNEEALASVNHSVADVDRWEQAHFQEDALRQRVLTAKREYEDALRAKYFGF